MDLPHTVADLSLFASSLSQILAILCSCWERSSWNPTYRCRVIKMKEKKEKKSMKGQCRASIVIHVCQECWAATLSLSCCWSIQSCLFCQRRKKGSKQTKKVLQRVFAGFFIPCSLSILTYLVYVGEKESRKRRIVLWHRPSQGHTPQPRQASGSIPSSLCMHTLCVGLSIPRLRCLLALPSQACCSLNEDTIDFFN